MNEFSAEVADELQQILELANDDANAAGQHLSPSPGNNSEMLSQTADDFADVEPGSGRQWRERLGTLLRLDSSQLPFILEALYPLLSHLPMPFLDVLGEQLRNVLHQHPDCLDDNALDFVEESLLRSSPDGRWSWLAILAVLQTPGCLDIFVRELLESPKVDQQRALMAFAPLMQKTEFDPEWIFPALFEGLRQAVLAPIIVDLANFCFRQGLCDEHPAASRSEELRALLEQLATRMGEIESDPTAWSNNADQISQMIADSVALIVSLCDTMALLDNQDAIATIEKVSQLRHRRVRAESAYALAKLGVNAGQETLLQLVDEPVSRLRVLKYAEELGIADQIDDQFRSSESVAESELALWLSQPNQMGVPPTEIELVDRRNQYWPSYDDPVECFLFRFEYRLGENSFSNYALVGPLTHAFLADLQILELDDVYAAFAGWQVEHDEIFELDLKTLSPHRQTDLFKLERRLHDFGAEKIETKMLAVFFGEVVAVASCLIEDQSCLAFVDGNQVREFPQTGERPLDETLVLSIYIGSKLLHAFNA